MAQRRHTQAHTHVHKPPPKAQGHQESQSREQFLEFWVPACYSRHSFWGLERDRTRAICPATHQESVLVLQTQVFMMHHCIPCKHQASPVMQPQGCVCQGMSLWCHWWILSISVLALSPFTGLSHENLSLIFWTVIFLFVLWHWNIQIIIIFPNLEVPVFIILIFIYFSNLSYFILFLR